MTDVTDKTIDAIAKLISLTRQEKLVWSPINPTRFKGGLDETILLSFKVKYTDKILGLYKRRLKTSGLSSHLKNEGLGLLSSYPQAHKLSEEYRGATEVVLEIVDDYENTLWEFPRERILEDLLSVVMYKTSGAGDLIERLIHDSRAEAA